MRHIQQTATYDPSLELYRDRLLYASVFQKGFDLEHKLKVKSGSFEVKVKIDEAKTIEKRLFFLFAG